MTRRAVAAGERLLGEKERELGDLGRVEYGLRRLRQRALAGPQLESPVTACILRGREQLRALGGERLVDDDEHALTRLKAARLDQVLGPAGVRHARLARLHRRRIVRGAANAGAGWLVSNEISRYLRFRESPG